MVASLWRKIISPEQPLYKGPYDSFYKDIKRNWWTISWTLFFKKVTWFFHSIFPRYPMTVFIRTNRCTRQYSFADGSELN